MTEYASYLPAGTLLQGGKYKIRRGIGSGGFGCTYEAEHTLMEKVVAIKEFFINNFCKREETSNNIITGVNSNEALVGKLRGKFIREGQRLSNLNHPNIVRVTDVFLENGTAYYVMDYLDGKSLQQIVTERGSLPEADVIDYMRQVCDALAYVHSRNMLHLDIKPGNIMVTADGTAYLIDFGASKQYDLETGDNTSSLLGLTPGFAPIEQMGNDVSLFSPATDIYSLGATIYKLITGNTPPEASKIINIPGALDDIRRHASPSTVMAVTRAMSPARDSRPQSVASFMSMLGIGGSDEITVAAVEIPDPTPAPAAAATRDIEYVDLGLSVLWATQNLGANPKSPCGDHYRGCKNYLDPKMDKSTVIVFNNQGNFTDIAGNPDYDPAAKQLGDGWRMPRLEEWLELIKKCDWQWVDNNGIMGYRVSRGGKSIFLPAAGHLCTGRGGRLTGNGLTGYYWTGMAHKSRDQYTVLFTRNSIEWDSVVKGDAHSIRPVRPKAVPQPADSSQP